MHFWLWSRSSPPSPTSCVWLAVDGDWEGPSVDGMDLWIEEVVADKVVRGADYTFVALDGSVYGEDNYVSIFDNAKEVK